MTATQLTLGGLTVALVLAAVAARTFWRSGKDPKSLLPSAEGLLGGVLASLCTGGILGWVSGAVAAGANGAGDWAMDGMTGGNAGSVAAGDPGRLSPGGALVTVIATALLVLAVKSSGKERRRRLVGGVIVGCLIGITAGAAPVIDATVLPLVNGLGDAALAKIGYTGGTA